MRRGGEFPYIPTLFVILHLALWGEHDSFSSNLRGVFQAGDSAAAPIKGYRVPHRVLRRPQGPNVLNARKWCAEIPESAMFFAYFYNTVQVPL